jgi:hypothetical protein
VLYKAAIGGNNMRKKGTAEMPFILVLLVLSLLVLGGMAFLFKDSIKLWTSSANPKINMIKALDCTFLGDNPLDPVAQADLDKDGYPDYCDVCLGTKPGEGNNKVDSDGDGMPDACDKDSEDPRVSDRCKKYQRCKVTDNKYELLDQCCTIIPSKANPVDENGVYRCVDVGPDSDKSGWLNACKRKT